MDAECALLVAEVAFADVVAAADLVAWAADSVTAVEVVLAALLTALALLVVFDTAADAVLLVELVVGVLSFLAQPAKAITPRATNAARRA
ncbi:hypothetical protein HAQ00_03645 [Acidithiobacillus caldus ATCC 51756]|uniref:Uncharacterized protein n=1 Tax=Acidithiobacillus caldus (strain ATCC 51756 / DSM 8584 / KU) TaxID=637389 RepID=A0A059ZRF7_ACICK|nr:hypothetical protein Acaty_c1600 [Acidithiobacillus caldus ATCC 51756]MBU2730208.1 hypothetical protein [Acidithiobacillus caldus]MBU2734834.1 hypothetical protein [Acidithiobacillus caldus ATCC 51756]MBU2745617.1 hypothetical protein [Acidithiobacillus caldus]MBU2764029.1 hypothetical protein [Acidithiobacillus caldus]